MFEEFIPENHKRINDASEAVEEFMNFVLGQIKTCLYHRPIKLSKKYEGHTITKLSMLQGRVGDYYHQASVIAKLGDNPMRNARPGVEKELVDDVVFLMKNGEIALNFLPLRCLWTRYFEDGKEVSLDELLTRYPKSAFTSYSDGQPHAMTLYASRVLSIA